MTRHRLLLPLFAVAALAVAGCGDKKLDTGKLEGKIKQGIEKQTGVKVKKVDCPSNVKVKKGNTFTCKATTVTGQVATVRVTQQDDKGNVNYQVGG
ncbi:MAG: hypothetical protein QOE65_361 [Solirubrobacteraceae bacterium]|jgi:hypothetical protein|nr:hypothetical protein [Solirubrobacteraceae bacterium]